MKKIIILLLIAAIVSCSDNGLQKATIKIKDKKYEVELALTNAEKEKGLMFRKSMEKEKGMLFVYAKKQMMFYYMKNTLIPLDIAFIDPDGIIVDIQKMEPIDETTVMSKDLAMYALEMNKAFFDTNGIKPGDKVEFITPIPHRSNIK